MENESDVRVGGKVNLEWWLARKCMRQSRKNGGRYLTWLTLTLSEAVEMWVI